MTQVLTMLGRSVISSSNTRDALEKLSYITLISSTIEPYDKCFLTMEHRGAEYLGALLLSDTAFCREIFGVLVRNRGKTIQEIGDIDLSYIF